MVCLRSFSLVLTLFPRILSFHGRREREREKERVGPRCVCDSRFRESLAFGRLHEPSISTRARREDFSSRRERIANEGRGRFVRGSPRCRSKFSGTGGKFVPLRPVDRELASFGSKR